MRPREKSDGRIVWVFTGLAFVVLFLGYVAAANQWFAPKNRAWNEAFNGVTEVRIGNPSLGDKVVVILRGNEVGQFKDFVKLSEWEKDRNWFLDINCAGIYLYREGKVIHSFGYSHGHNELNSTDGLWNGFVRLTPSSKQEFDSFVKERGYVFR